MKIKQTLFIIAAVLTMSMLTFSVSSTVVAQDCPDTSIIEVTCPGQGAPTQESGVWQLLVLALNILTAGVGIAAVGGIVYAAVLYASAQENAEQVKNAKTIIKNVVIGLVAYAGMYLMINFLIPGGIFS